MENNTLIFSIIGLVIIILLMFYFFHRILSKILGTVSNSSKRSEEREKEMIQLHQNTFDVLKNTQETLGNLNNILGISGDSNLLDSPEEEEKKSLK